MSRRLLFRPNAEADLNSILAYLATYSENVAARFVVQYADLTRSLLTHPNRGSVEPCDPAETLRRVIVPGFRNYLVYYRISPDAITVLHVFHSSRDLPTLLGESGDI